MAGFLHNCAEIPSDSVTVNANVEKARRLDRAVHWVIASLIFDPHQVVDDKVGMLGGLLGFFFGDKLGGSILTPGRCAWAGVCGHRPGRI